MTGQTAPVQAPQVTPKRRDQLFISDQPRFISEERERLIGKTIPDNLPGRAIPKPHIARLRPPANSIPIVGTGTGFIGKPIQKPISIGGVGGGRPVGGPVVRPGPKPVLKPTKDLIAGGFIKKPTTTLPPRMSVGGIGGFAGGRSGRMIRR
jgi:hypothetical protein